VSRVQRFLLAAAALLALDANADIFSPGELAEPHSRWEGVSNCTECHPAGSKLAQEPCLACHVELRPRVAAGKGFHGRISREERECEKCHSEHQGKDFKLTEWGPGGMKAFGHGKTGWPLLGKHAQVKCLDCHEKRLWVEATVVKFVSEHPKRENPTMLGLSERCDSCHFDEHRGQTSKDCQTCHNEKAWKPAAGFNHQKTKYPLLGKHRGVPCEKCHPASKDESTSPDVFPKPVSMAFMKYAPIAHKECISCHEDPHKGSFGERCQSCHVVEGWLIIHNALKQTEFHDKTRYPLRGEHISVPCAACHGPFPGIAAQFKNMKFDTCVDCHVDAHVGQIQKAVAPLTSAGPKCETCHVVDGFKPTVFDQTEHEKTRYPLEGAHQVVPCNGCHVPDPRLEAKVPAAVRLFLRKRNRQDVFSAAALSLPKVNGANAPCEQCHADVHAGQFKREQTCASCHTLTAWKQLTFDHGRDTNYPLTGKHQTSSCAGCHPVATLKGIKTAKYVGVERACDACHADVHVGQFTQGTSAPKSCDACHDTADFKETTFQHRPPFTDYTLDGAHKRVACEGCHPAFQVARNVTAVRYKPVPRNCEGCHTDFHKGEFKGFLP